MCLLVLDIFLGRDSRAVAVVFGRPLLCGRGGVRFRIAQTKTPGQNGLNPTEMSLHLAKSTLKNPTKQRESEKKALGQLLGHLGYVAASLLAARVTVFVDWANKSTWSKWPQLEPSDSANGSVSASNS